jgi:hypothetical protein
MAKKPTGPLGDWEPGPDDVPLFALPRTPKRSVGVERQRAAPTAATGWCPLHKGTTRTGVVISGSHYVWRTHTYMIGKTSVACRAAGKPICEIRPTDAVIVLVLTEDQRRTDNGQRKGRCRHEAGWGTTPSAP